MIRLIVNADDFGITLGVNAGILEVANHGILTSTSVMVDRPYASQITDFHRKVPHIGIGLHVEFSRDLLARSKSEQNAVEQQILAAIEDQIGKFRQLAGFNPDHLDFHKVAIRPTRTFVTDDVATFKPPVEKISHKYHLPWRGMSTIHVIDTFHGAVYDPATHKKSQMALAKISPKSLLNLLRSLKSGQNYEMMTHPGYVDAELTSSYGQEREKEISTLCSPAITREIRTLGIRLVPYSDLYV